jgi:hypothetical protein
MVCTAKNARKLVQRLLLNLNTAQFRHHTETIVVLQIVVTFLVLSCQTNILLESSFVYFLPAHYYVLGRAKYYHMFMMKLNNTYFFV